jgi:hypothetical protein
MQSWAARRDENGTVLVVLLILFVCFSGFVLASLTTVVAEDQRTTKRLYALQAQVNANSQLEFGKNLVNASPYDVNMNNQVLVSALEQPNQVIPGTAVRVERIGTTPYYRLTTLAVHMGVTKNAEAIVRQSSPASAYNLFVIDHPVGLSGRPRGAIHTNKWIDFFFPGGLYRDQVSAGEGFRFVAGATTANTSFTGVANPAAPSYDILSGVNFNDLVSRATTLAVTDSNLVSEVDFQGDTVEVKLYRRSHWEDRPYTYTWTEVVGYNTETYTDFDPIYQDVTYTVDEPVYGNEVYVENVDYPVYAFRIVTRSYQQPIYEDQQVAYTVQVPIYSTRTATRQETRRVWVAFDANGGASSSGGTVGATTTLTGYWTNETVTVSYDEQYISGYNTETQYRTEPVLVGYNTVSYDEVEQYVDYYETRPENRTRTVQVGTQTVTRTRTDLIGYNEVTRTRDVPIYQTFSEQRTERVWVREALERTERVPADGVVYLAGDVRRIKGRLEGRMSLISAGKVRISDNLVYVDSAGNQRMQNGNDPTQPYIDNPNYTGDSMLAIMAQGNVEYRKDCPTTLEVNASLISASGSVGFEGITVSADGTEVGTTLNQDGTYVKQSLRRLGGIVSRKRPVSTYINEWAEIGAGFASGESIMDQNLILSSGTNAPPPFMFESAQPTWILSVAGQKIGNVQ